MYEFKILSTYDVGREKVAEIMVTVQGADGPSQEERRFTWGESERYTYPTNGKPIPKTGQGFKQDIVDALEEEFNPKV